MWKIFVIKSDKCEKYQISCLIPANNKSSKEVILFYYQNLKIASKIMFYILRINKKTLLVPHIMPKCYH